MNFHDKTGWTHRDWEIAAGTIGEQTVTLIRVLDSVAKFEQGADPGRPNIHRIANEEIARTIYALTLDAAHCATRAQAEARRMADYLGAGVALPDAHLSAYGQLLKSFPYGDPRD